MATDVNARIIVATHKEYAMPEDELYVPLQVGAKISKSKLPYRYDDDGNNISDKNPYYCELTGLYWAWKNQDKLGNPRYIGLAHYRRHFALRKTVAKTPIKRLAKVLKKGELEEILKKDKIILPKKRSYYGVETIYSHYCHTMEPEPLLQTERIIEKYYPEYVPEFEKLKKRTTAHMFNMFIMERELFNKYCEWLFDILAKLEKEMSPKAKEYTPFQARFYGRISERLLDVYLRTNKIDDYAELPIIDVEGSKLIKRGLGALTAKIRKKKYDKSW